MRNNTISKSKEDSVAKILRRMVDMIVRKTGHEIVTMIIPFLHPHIHLAFAVGGLREILGQKLLLSIELIGCTLSPAPHRINVSRGRSRKQVTYPAARDEGGRTTSIRISSSSPFQSFTSSVASC